MYPQDTYSTYGCAVIRSAEKSQTVFRAEDKTAQLKQNHISIFSV